MDKKYIEQIRREESKQEEQIGSSVRVIDLSDL